MVFRWRHQANLIGRCARIPSPERPLSSRQRARSTALTRAASPSPCSNGKIVTIDGSRKNPVTDGYICAKVRRFADRVYGPDRLLYPAVRSGRKGDRAASRA